MAKQHDKQFKLDAVQYYQDHKDLGVRGCAENLGIGYSTLTKWLKDFRESGDIPVRGSGNYASDGQKEIARLRREWLNRFKICDYKQAYRLIFEYLEAFYNTKRIHSHCDFMSPDEFERVYKRAHIKAELLAG
ncbi:helix-turn-helix domain-containing protein [Hominenteromicrobium sp.]|uniref:helix-turn-helix domain-containing protein n=1 Tax=Hominenteromicrobium sp. TaxID=3073581 RepID=UPI00399C1E11